MKKIFQNVMLLLCGSTLLFTAGGCKKTNNGTKNARVVNVAMITAHPPYAYLENGDVTGIDVEVLREIARKKGLTLRFADELCENIVPKVSSGEYNVGGGGYSITDERKEKVNFTIPYDESPQVIIVLKNSALKSYSDLKKGKFRIGVTTGGMNMVYNAFKNHEIFQLTNYAFGIKEALLKNRIDGIVCDEKIASALIRNEPELKILPWPGSTSSYGFAVCKKDTQLLNILNEGIAELKASGKFDRIKKKFKTARSNNR